MSNETLSMITQWMYEEARQTMLEVCDQLHRLNQKLGGISHCIPWSSYKAEVNPDALRRSLGGRMVNSIESIRADLLEVAIEALHGVATDPQGMLPWDYDDIPFDQEFEEDEL